MKLFKNGAVLKVFAGTLVVCVVGLSFFYSFNKLHQNSNKSFVEGARVQKQVKITISPTPTMSPKVSLIPNERVVISPSSTQALIDCVGPDGKHLQLSQQDCDNFNNAWKSTPTSTPQQAPSNDATQESVSSNTTSATYIPVNSSSPVNPPATTQVDCSTVQSTIASMKGAYQPEIDQTTQATIQELEASGIPATQDNVNNTVQQKLQLMYAQENLQISAFCLKVSPCPCP
jgi:hypothetical protein